MKTILKGGNETKFNFHNIKIGKDLVDKIVVDCDAF